jgi:hypothetical protein
MSWLESEEKMLNKEIREKLKEDVSTKKLIWFFAFVGIILGCQIAQARESIICPCCTYEIELESPKAREIVGAGWSCDNCGMFQCHGQKCAYCGCKR